MRAIYRVGTSIRRYSLKSQTSNRARKRENMRNFHCKHNLSLVSKRMLYPSTKVPGYLGRLKIDSLVFQFYFRPKEEAGCY